MEKKQEKITCLLCADDSSIIGLCECNHKPFCYKCIFKLREIQ